MKIKCIKNPLKSGEEDKHIHKGSNYFDYMRYSRLSLRHVFNFIKYHGLGYKVCLKRK